MDWQQAKLSKLEYMQRPYYFNVIEERLSVLAVKITTRGKLNILDYHGHSENFYQFFLKELYGWSLRDLNEVKQNIEAIDLVEKDKKLVIQISATSTKQKVENSLAKELLASYKDFKFKFVSIANSGDELRRQTFRNPHGITFKPNEDILDQKSILSDVKRFHIHDQKRIYNFIKKELIPEVDVIKLETNLASIINILSKEDWDEQDQSSEINYFEIERKITYNKLDAARSIIDDYVLHFARINKIYKEFDLQGNNKSRSVLFNIRQEYIKNRSITDGDQLFFNIIQKVIEKILNSSNYIEIPFDELELSVNILVVDAFTRCKIFENPNEYKYASA